MATKWFASVQHHRKVMTDWIHADRLNAMAVTLHSHLFPSSPEPRLFTDADPLPFGWHRLLFQPRTIESKLSSDGYEPEFAPPGFNRRVWAGATLRRHIDNPLRAGQHVRETTTVSHMKQRQDVVFVVLNKVIENQDGLAVEDQRTLAYFNSNRLKLGPSASSTRNVFDARHTVMPSSTLLFRYSALTFNSHKIHYDLAYARDVEGYPDLVVHGPLTSTLLLDWYASRVPSAVVRSWSYRALHPLFCNQPLHLHCQQVQDDAVRLYVTNDEGVLCMDGLAALYY